MKIYTRYDTLSAANAPYYVGALPDVVLGFNVLLVADVPDRTRVFILERGTVGFYSDTRPLQFTAMYPEGNGPNGGPTESYRSDASTSGPSRSTSPRPLSGSPASLAKDGLLCLENSR
jgi:hypothetical protein